MASESTLNNYYNVGGFNRPDRIGYMMRMIRELKPLTVEEWRIWYLENVHDEAFLDCLANEMAASIPERFGVTPGECLAYINDVMFRRTFLGYNKEKAALTILRRLISPNVQEAPADWDTLYFIDFYLQTASGRLIGIQLKPDTFYHGRYQYVVDIRGKMNAFCQQYNADAFVLTYSTSDGKRDGIAFANPEVIEEIKAAIK